MDPAFWHDRWQRQDIGFHQAHIHDLLKRYWPGLGLAKGSTVFVPLCGKSRDMVWLADQGHRIIGAELSEIAIDQFFADGGLKPTVTRQHNFTVKSAGPYALMCGDIFQLTPDSLRDVAAVYDRAALIALPPDMRARYAATLSNLVPRNVPVLLISLDYNEHESVGPPFPVPQAHIDDLFAAHFTITLLESRDALPTSENMRKRGVTRLDETAYLLRRKA